MAAITPAMLAAMKQWRRERNKADHEAKQKKAGAREKARRKKAEATEAVTEPAAVATDPPGTKPTT